MADSNGSTAAATKPRRFRALFASARRVSLDSSETIKATVSKRQQWQEDFWAYYDEMPEVKYALNFLANGMQKVRFYAAARNEQGQIVAIDDESSPLAGTPLAAQAVAEMDRVRNGTAGQGEINRLLVLNLEGPGECHLHGMAEIAPLGIPGTDEYRPGRAESWDVRSVSEIEFSNQEVIDPVTGAKRPKVTIKRGPDDKGRDFDPSTEQLIRFWQRHPRFSEWADSHARAVMGDCEMLTLLQGEAKAVSKSRHTAGAFTLPSELSFVDASADGDEPQQGDEEVNPFIDAFMQHMIEPVEDPSSPSSVQRMIIMGPAEFLKPDVLRPIDLSRPADTSIDAKMDKHIQRLARGLNVPVEVVMGHMSTTFSNAEQIDQDKFNDHFEPRCISVADGYCFGYLRPQLLSSGADPAQVDLVLVGYDPAALVRDNSMEEKADSLLSNGAISLEAYRRYKGATEADAPDDIERLRNLVERKAILTADLALAIFKKVGVDLGVTAEGGDIVVGDTPADGPSDGPAEDEAPTPPPEEEEPVEEPVAASATPVPGRKLAALDRALRTRLAGAVDLAMIRALERAGNMVKNRGTAGMRAALRQIPSKRAVAHLGPTLLADAGITAEALLEGAWEDLGQSFKAWAADTGDEALKIVNDVLSGRLTNKQLSVLKARQAANIDEAWQWLSSSLDDVARRALFAPEVAQGLAEIGEIDTLSHVPAGVLREALMRAGGATGFTSRGGVVTPTNKTPLGGIATGEDMMGVLADNGMAVEAYEWTYGPAQRRTFQPHLDLAGVTFENFDDPVLANTSGWPETSHYYPGDHPGCVCDFTPVINRRR